MIFLGFFFESLSKCNDFNCLHIIIGNDIMQNNRASDELIVKIIYSTLSPIGISSKKQSDERVESLPPLLACWFILISYFHNKHKINPVKSYGKLTN